MKEIYQSFKTSVMEDVKKTQKILRASTFLILLSMVFLAPIIPSALAKLIGFIVFLMFLFLIIITMNDKTPVNIDEDIIEIKGIVIEKNCIEVTEPSVDKWGYSNKRARYNYLVIEEANGDIKNILISRMFNALGPMKY